MNDIYIYILHQRRPQILYFYDSLAGCRVGSVGDGQFIACTYMKLQCVHTCSTVVFFFYAQAHDNMLELSVMDVIVYAGVTVYVHGYKGGCDRIR